MDVLDIRMDQIQAPQQATIISHRQIQAVRVLQMPGHELTAAIHRERDTNPAFEMEERTCCHQCGSGLDHATRFCPVCGVPTADTEQSREAQDDFMHGSQDSPQDSPHDSPQDSPQDSIGDYTGVTGSTGSQFEDDGSDPMLRIAACAGRGEGLLQLLCTCLADAADEEIAEYLVGSLDHHGYLQATIVADAADALSCTPKRVEHVLSHLQRLDPPGIGARGPRECLLIQLRRLAELDQPHPLAERLVTLHLPALAFRHFREVARLIGETPKVVEGEWQFIRDHLHPYPTHGFDPDAGEIAEPAAQIRPDVVMRRRDNRFEAEVVERQRYDLQVNREYLWARKHFGTLGSSEADRAHVRGHVEQAQSFIAALKQRWDTMQRVSTALIELQHDFLEHGQCALKPLTRADVAKRVHLHESTVSRATDGKFVLLPNGSTVPFDDFFDSSLPVKKALRDLIGAEDPRRPLSDEQLARLLVKRGFEIARRTIAKYREEESILPSRLRRTRGAALATSRTATPRPAKVLAAVR